MTLNFERLLALNEVFKRLNVLRRWTSFVSDGKFNELAKQGLNCIVCYILACYVEDAGMLVRWERFPRIAIYRAFQKSFVNFDTPEYILREICEHSQIPYDSFHRATKEIITEKTDAEFSDYLSEGVNTLEARIYQAATKIATYVELKENAYAVATEDYQAHLEEICSTLQQFSDLPGLDELRNCHKSPFMTFQVLSTLRNKTRWASFSYTTECSVLGHLFDTACFAYAMSLEENPNDEALATRMFFMGIFHDVAETWTTDIPSPIKDRIPNFRKATEEYELMKLESEFYCKFPEFVVKKLKEVMLEDELNKQYKRLLKGADYLSADSECWRQYKGGSRDEYFFDAIKKRLPKIESGEVSLPPVCHELFDYFYNYAKSVI